MLEKILESKPLPPILKMNDGSVCNTPELWKKRRKEILELFSTEVYGTMPPAPDDVRFTVKEHFEDQIAGLASYSRIQASFTTPKGPFSFEFDFYQPYADHKVPAIVFMQFSMNSICSTFPVEEIIRNGFAVAMVYNGAIMPDRNDFSQPLGGMYLVQKSQWDDLCADAYAANRKREPGQWGMISVWAFGASRIMDYLHTLDTIDLDRIAIAGHSRLGKTALWCAANDERFKLAFISASGNSGASLSRFKEDDNEHIAQITEVFPYWFSKNYYKYAGHESEMPFDQHMLLASLAPRPFFVCSGSTDTWAGPKTEYLCCIAASEPYRMLGGKGLVHPDRFPVAGDVFDEGDVGYSMHEGSHFLGDFEWQNVMRFMKKMPTSCTE